MILTAHLVFFAGYKIRTWWSIHNTNSSQPDHRRTEAAKLFCYADDTKKQLLSQYINFNINIIKRGLAAPAFVLTTAETNKVGHLVRK
jgi:hypothetical protein